MSDNPFVFGADNDRISSIVKNLEHRWGLTLVSFLLSDAQKELVQVQRRISQFWGDDVETSLRQSRHFIKYYQPDHFHCTHFTLKRSDPGGPVKIGEFVKENHRLYELYEIIVGVTARMHPITVRFDRLRIATDGLGIVLLGEFENESAEQRRRLLSVLNDRLDAAFTISKRSGDADTSKFQQAHCCIGYLKRCPSFGYEAFVSQLKHIDFAPITDTFVDVALIHHTHRSLEFPQEGSFVFPLGKTIHATEEMFAQALNLAP